MKYTFHLLAAIVLLFSTATMISAQASSGTDTDSSMPGLRPPAIISNNNAVSNVPDEANELNTAGVKKALAGDYNGAVRDFQAAIKQAPSFSRASLNLALTFGYLEQYSNGISVLKDLVASDPGFADGHAVLGELLRRNGDIDAALVSLRSALKLNPNDEFALTSLGSCLDEKKMYPEAIEAFEKAIKVSPQYIIPYNNKGTALVKWGRNKEAVAVFRQAISMDKACADIYNNLGVALDNIHKKKEARQAFLEAVRLRPNWDYPRYNLAMSLIEDGDREEAMRQMNALSAIESKLADKVKEQLWAKYIVNASKTN